MQTVLGDVDGRKLAPYSLRHTFRARLQAAEVPLEVCDALMGHAAKDIGRRVYAGAMPVARMAEAVAKLDSTPVRELVARIESELVG